MNSEFDNKKIGERIRDERQKAGLSMGELASAVGTTRQTISRFENGDKVEITLDTLIELCKVFRCKVGYLLCEYGCADDKTAKLSTIQKRNKLNEVVRADEPGAGGACHVYMIQRRVFPVGEPEQVIPVAQIQFQHGARNEEGSTTGVLDGDLLEIVRDRLRDFQKGEYATRENACALTHIEEALMWMNKRAEDRAERNVLGTMQK